MLLLLPGESPGARAPSVCPSLLWAGPIQANEQKQEIVDLGKVTSDPALAGKGLVSSADPHFQPKELGTRLAGALEDAQFPCAGMDTVLLLLCFQAPPRCQAARAALSW